MMTPWPHMVMGRRTCRRCPIARAQPTVSRQNRTYAIAAGMHREVAQRQNSRSTAVGAALSSSASEPERNYR